MHRGGNPPNYADILMRIPIQEGGVGMGGRFGVDSISADIYIKGDELCVHVLQCKCDRYTLEMLSLHKLLVCICP